jgi:hypothetical protein
LAGLYISKDSLHEKNGNLYIQARFKMLDLLRETNIDYVGRCYSSVASEELTKAYIERNNVKRSKGSNSIQRLTGRKICGTSRGCYCRVPASDHAKLWIKDGKPYSYTFEPYGLSMEQSKALINFCEKHDCTFRVDNCSPHFPTGTLFVEIKRNEIS